MTREEILAFLNAEKGSTADKFLMKLILGFDCAFYFAIAIFGLLLEAIGFDAANLTINVVFVLQIVVFLVWYKLSNNISQTYMFVFVTTIMTTLKLIYGYVIFQIHDSAKFGTSLFGPFHIIVLILMLILAAHMSLGIFKAYKSMGSKKETKASKKTVIIGSIAAASILSPLLLNLLGDDIKEHLVILGLGIGFCLWVLACIWLFLAIIIIPKLVISQKYKHLIAEEK
jgi:hypothetical protein